MQVRVFVHAYGRQCLRAFGLWLILVLGVNKAFAPSWTVIFWTMLIAGAGMTAYLGWALYRKQRQAFLVPYLIIVFVWPVISLVMLPGHNAIQTVQCHIIEVRRVETASGTLILLDTDNLAAGPGKAGEVFRLVAAATKSEIDFLQARAQEFAAVDLVVQMRVHGTYFAPLGWYRHVHAIESFELHVH